MELLIDPFVLIYLTLYRFTPEYIYLQRDDVDFFEDANCKHFLYVPDLYFDDTVQVAHSLVSKVCLTSSEVFRCKFLIISCCYYT